MPPVQSSSAFRVLLFFRRRRLAKRDASRTASREVQSSTWQGQPRNRAVTRRYATPVDAKRTTETRGNDGPRPGARPDEARPARDRRPRGQLCPATASPSRARARASSTAPRAACAMPLRAGPSSSARPTGGPPCGNQLGYPEDYCERPSSTFTPSSRHIVI